MALDPAVAALLPAVLELYADEEGNCDEDDQALVIRVRAGRPTPEDLRAIGELLASVFHAEADRQELRAFIASRLH